MLSATLFPDVFVSYAHEDAEWAANLVRRLRQEGFTVFFDKDSLRYGDDIPLVVDRALTSALRIVFIMSLYSLQSKWAQFESTYDWEGIYIESSARLVPLRLAVKQIPPRLKKLKYVDFQDCDFEEGFNNLLSAIRSIDEIALGPLKVKDAASLDALTESASNRLSLYFDFDAGTMADLALCCTELGNNALTHTKACEAVITIRATATTVVTEVLDYGPGFDVDEELQSIARNRGEEPRKPSGRGLQLVAAHSDRLAAAVGPDGNRVTAYFSNPRSFRLVREPLRSVLSAPQESRFTCCAPLGAYWVYTIISGKVGRSTKDPGLADVWLKLGVLLGRFERLALDLRACPFLDSSGITDLVDVLNDADAKNIQLLLVLEKGSRLGRTLDTIQISQYFTIAESTEEAEEWLAIRQPKS